jgi:hypothetical protein
MIFVPLIAGSNIWGVSDHLKPSRALFLEQRREFVFDPSTRPDAIVAESGVHLHKGGARPRKFQSIFTWWYSTAADDGDGGREVLA